MATTFRTGSTMGSSAPRTAFGTVPRPVAMPNPAADLAAQYPGLSEQNAQISSNIMSELEGQLSPETLNSIRDASAVYGVTSGMPGSGLQTNRTLRDLGLTTEQVQGKGLEDYLNAITGISRTQTVAPELQTEINTQNAIWASAPDPAMAARRQETLFDKYLRSLSGPAGGTGANPLGAGAPVGAIGRRDLYGPGGIGDIFDTQYF